MSQYADKSKDSKSAAITSPVSQQQKIAPAFQFVDNRPEATAQRKMQEAVNNSSRLLQQGAHQDMADRYTSAVTQRKEKLINEIPQPIQRKENNTGLPDHLKTGVENLSGISMDDVKVHYNSAQPAQLQAHAYAQGTDIHLAPGQEKHLPHEAWHVVQQKQGRVKPTVQMKGKVNINEDKGLEKEADDMGREAMQFAGKNFKAEASIQFDSGNYNNEKYKLIQKKLMDDMISKAAIQLKGERSAVLNTRDTTRSAGQAIRRGNRRGSVVGTGGASTAKLSSSEGYRSKVQGLEGYIIEKLVERGHDRGKVERFINKNRTFVQAKAVEEISVGNCGEFAQVVFASLVQQTTGQWVCRASLHGELESGALMDHAFNITYFKDFPNDTVEGLDKERATIADAWDGYQVMTLKQFMEGGNAYGIVLQDENIVIGEKREATGKSILSSKMLADITEWARDFNQEFTTKMADPDSAFSKYAERKKRGAGTFNTNGSNVERLKDRRTFHQQWANSTEGEKRDILESWNRQKLFDYLTKLVEKKRDITQYTSLFSPELLAAWAAWQRETYTSPEDAFEPE